METAVRRLAAVSLLIHRRLGGARVFEQDDGRLAPN